MKKEIPRIKSVMTPFPYSIEAAEPLARAQAMMTDHDFRHLPVMSDGKLVGVVSERRVREALERGDADQRQPSVRDATEQEALIVDLGARLDTVALEMARRHLGAALVVKEGRLAGIFTVTDACRCLGEYLRSEFPLTGGDDVA